MSRHRIGSARRAWVSDWETVLARDADEHLVLLGHRLLDLRDAEDLGRAVPILDHGFHVAGTW